MAKAFSFESGMNELEALVEAGRVVRALDNAHVPLTSFTIIDEAGTIWVGSV